jgi:hypothetical protein
MEATKSIRFSIHTGMMTCGQYEQSIRKYKKLIGKRGTWYIAIQQNAADNIYFSGNSANDSLGFKGFGGAALSFELEDGTIERVTGPWHSNANSLLEDTGYDITDQYYTQGIVAKQRIYDYLNGDEYIDVLHYDEEPILGNYERIKSIAQVLEDHHKCRMYYAIKSNGGGSSCQVDPK